MMRDEFDRVHREQRRAINSQRRAVNGVGLIALVLGLVFWAVVIWGAIQLVLWVTSK